MNDRLVYVVAPQMPVESWTIAGARIEVLDEHTGLKKRIFELFKRFGLKLRFLKIEDVRSKQISFNRIEIRFSDIYSDLIAYIHEYRLHSKSIPKYLFIGVEEFNHLKYEMLSNKPFVISLDEPQFKEFMGIKLVVDPHLKGVYLWDGIEK